MTLTLENIQSQVVQRLVKLNPGLSKRYSTNCFSKEKSTVLITYCSDFPREKLANDKFTDQFCVFLGWKQNHGLNILPWVSANRLLKNWALTFVLKDCKNIKIQGSIFKIATRQISPSET